MKGNNIGIVLEGPGNILIEFNTNNNQVDYEALIADMVFTLDIRASRLKTKSDPNWASTKSSSSTRRMNRR